jgi:glycosyltransferase involved in cell wall biosynthesis
MQFSSRTALGQDGKQPHILIIGINYAPETTGNAPYTTGLAEHLVREGFRVTVFTGLPYYPEWSVPEAYRGKLRASEVLNGVEVKRFRTYIPPRQTAIRRIAFEGGFFLNGLISRLPDRPDAILGIVPSLSGAGLAALWAKRLSVPYGLLFQDLVGAAARQSGMPGGGAVANITTGLEGRAARAASHIAVISRGFRGYLEDVGVSPDRIRHIRPRASVRQDLGWKADEVIILHSGAMGLKQGLEHVVNAARRAATESPSLRFVLMGDGNQRATLEERAKGLDNVTFLPPSDADMFPNILAAADMLLINERASLRDMALPSKLTSYLVAGRPIVAAVSPEGETAREVERTGAGIVVPPEDPDALLGGVMSLADDPDRANSMGQAGPAYAQSTLSAPAILGQAQAFIQDILDSRRSS